MNTSLVAKPTHIVVYTDGACIGNPGPGGYAATVRWMRRNAEHRKLVLTGHFNRTTNNRMEMLAVVSALNAISDDALPIILRSDSRLVVDGINTWLPNWVARRWTKSDGKPVENVDLWRPIWAQVRTLSVTAQWVKAHMGEPFNEEVDALAQAEARNAVAA